MTPGSRHLAALLALCLLGACSRPPYPADRAERGATRADCSHLEGRYSDAGWDHDGSPAEALSWLLTERTRETPEPESVEIRVEPGPRLTAVALSQGQPVAQRSYSASTADLACSENGAVLEDYSGMTRGKTNAVVGYEGARTALFRDADGSLVVEQSGTSVGMVFLVIPIGVSGRTWSRFPPAESVR